MFACRISEEIELRQLQNFHATELFGLINSNRAHLRVWYPWLDATQSVEDTERMITSWLQQAINKRGIHAGIWYKGVLCGEIGHLNVDWQNRSTWLQYWLDEKHQGRGIATQSCRALLAHAFQVWGLNRVTIECATANTRSRALAERLGFRLEGTARDAEWLYDHYVDHAFYAMLNEEWNDVKGQSQIIKREESFQEGFQKSFQKVRQDCESEELAAR